MSEELACRRRNLSDERLTQVVLESFENAASPRIKEVMQSLVKHLHAFAVDVQLTEEEWAYGIDFLTRTGHITDDKRQEFILLSDVLGLSMQVIGINHPVPDGATENTVFGPFFVADSPAFSHRRRHRQRRVGHPVLVPRRRARRGRRADRGRAPRDLDGRRRGQLRRPVRRPRPPPGPRATCTPPTTGKYWFWSVLPEAYPIPHDGPVGDLLKGAGRHPMRPAHIHFQISAPGYKTCTTHVFVDGDEYLDSDAVFGVKSRSSRASSTTTPAPTRPTAATSAAASGGRCTTTSSWPRRTTE